MSHRGNEGSASSQSLVRVLQLKFAKKHIPAVLKGMKTSTLRIGLEKDVFQTHDVVHLTDPEGLRFATVIITGREQLTVKEATKTTFKGHRNYCSVEKVISEFEKYYPSVEITPNTQLDVVQWDVTLLWS